MFSLRHQIWPGEGATVQWKWSPARLGSLKALLFPPLLNKVQNKGTQGVQARYGAELSPGVDLTLLNVIWGKSKSGLTNGGLMPLSATRAQSSAIVHMRVFLGWAEPKREGAKRTEKQNLARMAPWKPFLETLRKWFLSRSPEGNS